MNFSRKHLRLVAGLLGALFVGGVLAAIAARLQRPWGRVLVRVAGSWMTAVALLVRGPLELVVIHFPGGCIAATRDGEVIAKPSLDVPSEAIVGANGAGDAFAAGVLYGIHEGWAIRDSLTLGLCAAASALRSISTTASVGSVAECLALADQWGWRSPI